MQCPPESGVSFKKHKEELSIKLYQEFNDRIFDGRLPCELNISWNKRTQSTAGRAISSYHPITGARLSKIELSDKVVKLTFFKQLFNETYRF